VQKYVQMPTILYNNISQFEPLIPSELNSRALYEKAHVLLTEANALSGQANATLMEGLAPMLRAMNSYYTNRIEGQHTLPREIEAAVARNYDTNDDIRRKQHLAIAHMQAEQWAESHYAQTPWQDLFAPAVVQALHKQLFTGLAPEHLQATHASEAPQLLVPGQLRTATQQVRVGRHDAPNAESVPAFLTRFEQAYSKVRSGEQALIALACANHRLVWIHPFADGNGRVVRLHSHVLIQRMGLSSGAWSPLRGLARTQEQYYAMLANADQPRMGDLDGRGNLSEKHLIAFVHYFFDTCLDQVRFMRTMLDMRTLRERIRSGIEYESAQPESKALGVRPEAALALYTLFLSGSMDRGDFKTLTGLQGRTADKVLAGLVARRLVVPASEATPLKGKIRFGIPYHSLKFYFPALWPEAQI
jgi:Fic family protein